MQWVNEALIHIAQTEQSVSLIGGFLDAWKQMTFSHKMSRCEGSD